MRLEKVFISYNDYREQYQGSADFSNELGKVELTLLPDQVELILDACADALIESSKIVADQMTVKTIEHFKERKKLLTSNEETEPCPTS